MAAPRAQCCDFPVNDMICTPSSRLRLCSGCGNQKARQPARFRANIEATADSLNYVFSWALSHKTECLQFSEAPAVDDDNDQRLSASLPARNHATCRLTVGQYAMGNYILQLPVN